MTRKLILDLDTGIDDTLAIAYALASEQADDVDAGIQIENEFACHAGLL